MNMMTYLPTFFLTYPRFSLPLPLCRSWLYLTDVWCAAVVCLRFPMPINLINRNCHSSRERSSSSTTCSWWAHSKTCDAYQHFSSMLFYSSELLSDISNMFGRVSRSWSCAPRRKAQLLTPSAKRWVSWECSFTSSAMNVQWILAHQTHLHNVNHNYSGTLTSTLKTAELKVNETGWNS